MEINEISKNKFRCRWYLTKRLSNYIEKNKKLPPLARLEYYFLRDLYRYLTKQIMHPNEKRRLFQEYQKLVNLCYFPNRETININMVEILYIQGILLLERDYSSPYTFILLNNDWHYQKLLKTLDIFFNWALNDKNGNYMDQKEFWENMEFIRKEYNNNKIDFYYEIGKWPKKLRKRFNRLEHD